MFVIYACPDFDFCEQLGGYHLNQPSDCAWLVPGTDDHRGTTEYLGLIKQLLEQE